MKNTHFSLKFGGGNGDGGKSICHLFSFFLICWSNPKGSMEHCLETTNLDVWILQLLFASEEEKIGVVSTDFFSIIWVYHVQINLLSPTT